LQRWKQRRIQRQAEADQRVLRRQGWYSLSRRSEEEAIFVGGCGRSGTTLFREILGRHPNIAFGPETSMFGLPFNVRIIALPWAIDPKELRRVQDRCSDLLEFADIFYREYLLKDTGKSRWADKTPNNVHAIERLLTWYPNGRFIHILRDGRDVVCSLRHHPRQKYIKGRLVDTQVTNSISMCSMRWLEDTSRGLAFQNHPRYLEVRYEDLVSEPGAVVQGVCEFLGEEPTEKMLEVESIVSDQHLEGRLMCNANAADPISRSSIGRWRRDLSLNERHEFVDVAGELLLALGYVSDHEWVNEKTTV
jgi:hypothetical protein